LTDVSLEVEEGEVLSVIGPSGSGKSTLLRIFNQLTTLDSGTVSVCGLTMVESEAGRAARYAPKKTLHEIQLKCGLVFQDFNLFRHFSVLRNVVDAQVRVLGRSRDEAVVVAERLLEKMGLSDKRDAYPYQLSGGQAQRVSIARALALSPAALFFDEPTSALDPQLTGEILRVIKDLAAERMTMVVVTHEMSFAREISDRVVFMHSGVVVDEGSAEHVFDESSDERVRRFLNSFEV
jgi:polar amino acid transport system ATP-binding protein